MVPRAGECDPDQDHQHPHLPGDRNLYRVEWGGGGGVQILFMNHCTIFANHWDMALTAISLESDNLVESSFHYILLIPLPAPQVRNTTNCWLEPKAACKYVKWNECRWCDMLPVVL